MGHKLQKYKSDSVWEALTNYTTINSAYLKGFFR